jgi:hypothetical protein
VRPQQFGKVIILQFAVRVKPRKKEVVA